MKQASIQTSGITDIGLKREINEDSFTTDDGLRLYIVADGMGGHLAGEVASKIAVDLIRSSYERWCQSNTPVSQIYGFPDPSLSTTGNYVLAGIRLANRVIHEMATQYEKYQGMGTTVAVLAVAADLIITANTGDSNIYLIRNGTIERLSKEHTIVAEQVELGLMTPEEAATSPMRHMLTKSLGSSDVVKPEVFEITANSNDRFVLCSDGLSDLVSDEEILHMVQQVNDPDTLCHGFLDLALKRGGHDNTTVVSVFFSGGNRAKLQLFGKVGTLLSDFYQGILKILNLFKP
jgi:protein phosphatase